jgi:hypothetical protein
MTVAVTVTVAEQMEQWASQQEQIGECHEHMPCMRREEINPQQRNREAYSKAYFRSEELS